ncbi:unnamed protein product [Thelazia callipaeda]|uniref:HNH endonuclease n=1 Tax=Thelazia callipaeda TaxID=103827 RepID=A0A0N5CXS4_THECL|nr:unnamed protein product [Thelazia callipaeda]
MFLKNESEWYVCDATPIPKGYGGLTAGSALFPVAQIQHGNKDRKKSNDECFGAQLHRLFTANIVCNYYYRDPVTREAVFTHSKTLEKR